MGLQVWLPLNGNLNNQGLSGVTLTNNGATVNNSGKIGQCYNFNGNNTITTNYVCPSTDCWSVSCWVKPSLNSGTICRSADNKGPVLDFYVSNSSLHIRGFVWYSSSAYYMIDYILPSYNTWMHLALTQGNGQLTLYLNGALIQSIAAANALYTTSELVLGYGSGYGYLIGQLNDFRFYDNCLSADQIKEIARGLVLHYPLDNNGWGNENILRASGGNTFTTGNDKTWADGKIGCGSGGNGTFSVTEDLTCPVGIWSWNVLNNTSGNRDFQQIDMPYIAGNVYTMSWYAKGNGTCLARSWNTTKGTEAIRTTFTLTSDWKYYTWTFTATSAMETDSCSFHLGVTGSASINMCGMKLENGSKATPWAPNSLDDLATIIGFNATIEYDTSGFQNNGTRIGTFVHSSDTPKYHACTDFNGTNNAIIIPFDATAWQTNFTMNIWFKKDALGTKNYETLIGGPSGFEMDTRANNATTLSLYMASVRGGNLYSPFEFGTWYMVTLVNDGTNEYYYVNGELVNTIEKKSMPTGTYYIGAWQTEAKQNYYGLMSDMRVYATALSAEDIMELYKSNHLGGN